MATMMEFSQLVRDLTATATGYVKQGLSDGALTPIASCHQNATGGWGYHFEIRSPQYAEPVFAAVGDNAGPVINGGYPLSITQMPPGWPPQHGYPKDKADLLVYHSPPHANDDRMHRIWVEMKPLGNDGEFITLAAAVPAGAEAEMALQ